MAEATPEMLQRERTGNQNGGARIGVNVRYLGKVIFVELYEQGGKSPRNSIDLLKQRLFEETGIEVDR